MTPSNTPEHGERRGGNSSASETHESNQSLWMLTVAPTIWAVHFLASYITAAIWCAKVVSRDASLGTVRVAIAVYTILALGGIGWMAWIGYRRHNHGADQTSHERDIPEDRHRFLGFATLLLASLSAVATLYVAMVILFMETCH